MRTVLLLFCLLIGAGPALSQKIESDKPPYLLVDSFRTDLRYLVIDAGNIESINVFKDSTAVLTYGEEARYGAVIIKTLPRTKLLRLPAILDKYNILATDRSLRVCIDKTLVAKTAFILIEEASLAGVEITTDRYWINAEDAISGERFINIRTSPKKQNNR